jgi:hypothetical protein
MGVGCVVVTGVAVYMSMGVMITNTVISGVWVHVDAVDVDVGWRGREAQTIHDGPSGSEAVASGRRGGMIGFLLSLLLLLPRLVVEDRGKELECALERTLERQIG